MKIMTEGMELTFAGTGVGETETRWEQRGEGGMKSVETGGCRCNFCPRKCL